MRWFSVKIHISTEHSGNVFVNFYMEKKSEKTLIYDVILYKCETKGDQ